MALWMKIDLSIYAIAFLNKSISHGWVEGFLWFTGAFWRSQFKDIEAVFGEIFLGPKPRGSMDFMHVKYLAVKISPRICICFLILLMKAQNIALFEIKPCYTCL